jgi:hypothetical protein
MHRIWPRAVAAGALMAGTVAGGAVARAGTAPTEQTFSYSGAPEEFTVPADVCSLTVEALGAAGNVEQGSIGELRVPRGFTPQGQFPFIAAGGLGGSATATVDVTPGEVLAVYVGGQGGGTAEGYAGGFNGGGDGANAEFSPSGGGGGGSDVRRGAGGLEDRLVVAGGGGGGGAEGEGVGGHGGGTVGTDGADSGDGSAGGLGGTQTAGGAGGADDPTAGAGVLGAGGVGGSGDNENDGGGGGGGGYYGGGGGAGDTSDAESDDGGGGGGGSGFGPAGTVFETGVNEGDGAVTLSWTAEPGCDETPTTPTPSAQPAAETRPRFTG